jgi:hypothetical protein
MACSLPKQSSKFWLHSSNGNGSKNNRIRWSHRIRGMKT